MRRLLLLSALIGLATPLAAQAQVKHSAGKPAGATGVHPGGGMHPGGGVHPGGAMHPGMQMQHQFEQGMQQMLMQDMMINQQRRAMKSQKTHSLNASNASGSSNPNMNGAANSIQGGNSVSGATPKGLGRAAAAKLNSSGGGKASTTTVASTTGGPSTTTGNGSTTTPTSTTKPAAPAEATKGHHAKELAKANHHQHIRELAGWWWGWPLATHPTYLHLNNLQSQLNHVANTRAATPGNINSLSAALHRVVWNSPSQSSTNVRQLANDVAVSLASRGNAAVNTRDLALHLRAVMNGPRLVPGELATSLTAERNILAAAKVADPHIAAVVGDSEHIGTFGN